MQIIDFKKELRQLYQPSAREVVLVDVPAMNFLMADGQGDPNTAPTFAAAVEALYAVAYTIKFAVKKGALAVDYGVMPLEALWWADDMADFARGDKARWKWTAMILQPALVTPQLMEEAIADVRRKKNLPGLGGVYVKAFTEGLCAQTLHVGPFSEEGPTIERVHAFIAERGTRTGMHHEIYLSDIRRAEPAKWKTIVRQPLALASQSP